MCLNFTWHKFSPKEPRNVRNCLFSQLDRLNGLSYVHAVDTFWQHLLLTYVGFEFCKSIQLSSCLHKLIPWKGGIIFTIYLLVFSAFCSPFLTLTLICSFFCRKPGSTLFRTFQGLSNSHFSFFCLFSEFPGFFAFNVLRGRPGSW